MTICNNSKAYIFTITTCYINRLLCNFCCCAHFNKGYVYFAMAFSLAVEFLNLRVRPRVPQAAEASAAEPS